MLGIRLFKGLAGGMVLALVAIAPASATSFYDDFDRPNGSVGNGWSNLPGAPDGNLIIHNKTLVPSKTNCDVGVSRPIGYAGIVTLSAPMTQQNGYGGLTRRYVTRLIFKNDGSLMGGYGVTVYRGDQNYDNSAVYLTLNGTLLQTIPSTFQFGTWLHVDLNLFPDGRIWGRVRGDGHRFTFAFPKHYIGNLTGQNFAIVQGCPDDRAGPQIYPRINSVSIDYDNPD